MIPSLRHAVRELLGRGMADGRAIADREAVGKGHSAGDDHPKKQPSIREKQP
jgi:hypothetical protein